MASRKREPYINKMTETISERLDKVRKRINAACEKSGRNAGEVRILAASKSQPPEQIIEAARCGLEVFGENRVQEAGQKIPLCPSNLEWHMIGHLQTNKARDAVRMFQMIHSVDSQKLLTVIDTAVGQTGRVMPVCIEVNVSGEGSKFGLPPESVAGLLTYANSLKHVEIIGLMSIPPLAEDPELSRPFFRKLRLLRDQLRGRTGFALNELSIGMSHDFEIAIEEGATWIRLGTIIFGERKTVIGKIPNTNFQ
jgi:pyridoxal phosphate enzyme (YggS family)